MFTIIALGNPGEKYKDTRHNVGRHVVDGFLNTHNFPTLEKKGKEPFYSAWSSFDMSRIEIVYPDVFMNESGSVVKRLIDKYEIDPKCMIVVYDDVDLPIGDFKISFGRGDGGHNGIKSIIDHIKTKDFMRIRIGISPKSLFGGMKKPHGSMMAKFVLGRFSFFEQKKLKEVSQNVTKAIELIIKEGREIAMNHYN